MNQEPNKGEEMESLAVRDESAALLPVMSIETATDRYKTIVKYVKELMAEGSDYGKIPGTDKNTLLKPGAEKLCTLFGLSKRFALVGHTEDWRGDQMGEPFFNYLYRCALYRGEVLIAEADGSCNSRETKYRWRQGERKCPGCDSEAIIKGKAEYGGGWVCFRKKGGCGMQFGDNDERITSQQIGRVPNPDIADQVNTIQKMAQKRALIAATLLAVNASEFFTQDMEDFLDAHPESIGGQAQPNASQTKAPQARAESEKRPPPRKRVNEVREQLIKSVVQAFKLLNDAGHVPPWTKKSSNEFVALHFQGAAGVDELEEDQLSDLLRMLSEKADSLKNGDEKKANLIASIKTYFDTDAHLNNYMKDHGGKTLEQLSIPELETIELDLKVPF
jgi:hypothetical protein